MGVIARGARAVGSRVGVIADGAATVGLDAIVGLVAKIGAGLGAKTASGTSVRVDAKVSGGLAAARCECAVVPNTAIKDVSALMVTLIGLVEPPTWSAQETNSKSGFGTAVSRTLVPDG